MFHEDKSDFSAAVVMSLVTAHEPCFSDEYLILSPRFPDSCRFLDGTWPRSGATLASSQWLSKTSERESSSEAPECGVGWEPPSSLDIRWAFALLPLGSFHTIRPQKGEQWWAFPPAGDIIVELKVMPGSALLRNYLIPQAQFETPVYKLCLSSTNDTLRTAKLLISPYRHIQQRESSYCRAKGDFYMERERTCAQSER